MAEDEQQEDQEAVEEEEEFEPGPAPSANKQDPLNTEFVYYSTVLKMIGPTITANEHRIILREWIKKLFRPEYQSSQFKEKRNRYLAYLTTSMMLNELMDAFSGKPPDGALQELNDLPPVEITAAEWELEKMWQETLENLPDNFKKLSCSIHDNPEECAADHKLDRILDQEFQLFLYMARPLAALLASGPDKIRVATWLQILCSVYGDQHCSSMKAIRNDYIMALLGYLQDLRPVGPFEAYPSWQTLEPLVETAKNTYQDRPITDPTGPEANQFLFNQPMPEDGAYCYIAITGDLINSTLS